MNEIQEVQLKEGWKVDDLEIGDWYIQTKINTDSTSWEVRTNGIPRQIVDKVYETGLNDDGTPFVRVFFASRWRLDGRPQAGFFRIEALRNRLAQPCASPEWSKQRVIQ